MPNNKNSVRKAGCLAGALLLLCLASAAAAGGLALLVSRRPAGLPLFVQLRLPETGRPAQLNHPLGVEAEARSLDGVTRLELYADGALVGAQDTSLPTGSNPLLYRQPWTPLVLGRHALVTRAYDKTGLFADSNVVYVNVIALIDAAVQVDASTLVPPANAPPSLNAVAETLGVPLSQLLALNAVLSGSDPAAPLPAGTLLTLPPSPAPSPPLAGDLAHSPRAGALPAPTNLSATLDCAAAALTWTGAAGISQYDIYRLGAGDSSPQWVGSSSGASAYSDPLPGPGEYRYQVASASAGAEALGPMVTASTPADCVPAPRPVDSVDVRLAAISLETSAPFEGVYCYLSVDGSPFERVPRGDFSLLSPDASGTRYDLPAQLPNAGQFVLAAHSVSAPVRLAGDCWGRSGLLSVALGAFASDDPPAKWDGTSLQAGLAPAAQVAALPAVSSGARAAPIRAAAGARLTYALTADRPGAASLQSAPDLWLVQAFGIPAPERLRIENSTLACDELAHEDARRNQGTVSLHTHEASPSGEHLERDSGAPADPLAPFNETLRQAFAEQAICALSAGRGGAPTLMWDWGDKAGRFTEASLVGYHVSAVMTDLNAPLDRRYLFLPDARPTGELAGIEWQRDIRPGTRKATLARAADLPCNIRLTFTVTAVYSGWQSVPSDPLSVESEPCDNAATVTISIESLVTGAVHDTETRCPLFCSADALEAMGTLFVGAGRPGFERQWLSDPGETRAVEIHDGSRVTYTRVYVRSTNPLNTVRAGQLYFADQLLLNVDQGVFGMAERGRQTWVLRVRAGDTLPVGTRLVDWDGTGADAFCNTDLELPARRPTVWFATDETLTMRDTRGEATCEVAVHVVGSR